MATPNTKWEYQRMRPFFYNSDPTTSEHEDWSESFRRKYSSKLKYKSISISLLFEQAEFYRLCWPLQFKRLRLSRNVRDPKCMEKFGPIQKKFRIQEVFRSSQRRDYSTVGNKWENIVYSTYFNWHETPKVCENFFYILKRLPELLSKYENVSSPGNYDDKP